MPFFSFLGKRASMTDLWKRRRGRMLALSQYTEDVMRAESPLTPAQREIIAAMISGVNGCDYCYPTHKAFAAAHGVDEAMIETLVDDIEAADIAPAMKPLLSFCRKLNESPDKIAQADADAVFSAGWSEEALEDAVHVTALFNLYNRLMDGHGIPRLNERVLRPRAEFIKSYGYDFSTYPEEYQP